MKNYDRERAMIYFGEEVIARIDQLWKPRGSFFKSRSDVVRYVVTKWLEENKGKDVA